MYGVIYYPKYQLIMKLIKHDMLTDNESKYTLPNPLLYPFLGPKHPKILENVPLSTVIQVNKPPYNIVFEIKIALAGVRWRQLLFLAWTHRGPGSPICCPHLKLHQS